MKLRLKPIRVFCYHQVSDVFNPETTWECDWKQTDVFKGQILDLLHNGVSFISLADAYEHIQHDLFRTNRYAVITFDDGSRSVQDIVPWLAEQSIPVTLFVNPLFLLGEGKREKPMEFLSYHDLELLVKKYPSLITLASHSYGHEMCDTLNIEEFQDTIRRSEDVLSSLPGKIPFFAYPCGRHTSKTDNILIEQHLVPVYCDGMKNYGCTSSISRELL